MNSKRRIRKSRTKAKKPKFLSLQFLADETAKTELLAEMRPTDADVVVIATSTDFRKLNLLPSQLQDRENNDHENVAYFFAADGCSTTITGLLDTSAVAAASNSSHVTNNISSSRADDLSTSSAYAYGGQDSEPGAALVRNALRNRERDSSEDKWVCYSEVVERKVKEEEVTSSAFDLRSATDDRLRIQRLALKLDYQEIMDTWSDKGPLYLHSENTQIVPDVNDEFRTHGWGCNVGLWSVPKMVGDIDHNGDVNLKNEQELKIGQREASVLRYKEKRLNRLFSNKIRYEVRKLNAQKRPRLKGRFVKRS